MPRSGDARSCAGATRRGRVLARRRPHVVAPPRRPSRTHPCRRRGEPAHRRRHRRRQRGSHLGVGHRGARDRAVMVRGDGGRTRACRRAVRGSRCVGPAAVLGARDRDPPAGVRSRRRSVRVRPLARLVEARARWKRGGVPVRLRAELHDGLERERVGHGDPRRRHCAGHGAQHRRPRRHRDRAGVLGRSSSARRLRACRDHAPRGNRRRDRHPPRALRRPRRHAACDGRAAGALHAARSRDRLPTTASRSTWRSAQLPDGGHHLRGEEPHVAL